MREDGCSRHVGVGAGEEQTDLIPSCEVKVYKGLVLSHIPTVQDFSSVREKTTGSMPTQSDTLRARQKVLKYVVLEIGNGGPAPLDA